jgi:hypothetical protein
MAVTSQGAVYSGLSSDTKPTANLTTGNLFVETNTNRIFQWSGSAWVTIGASSAYAFFLS